MQKTDKGQEVEVIAAEMNHKYHFDLELGLFIRWYLTVLAGAPQASSTALPVCGFYLWELPPPALPQWYGHDSNSTEAPIVPQDLAFSSIFWKKGKAVTLHPACDRCSVWGWSYGLGRSP